MSQLKDLQLVVLDCPYRTWTQEITQKLFSKMVLLKLNGYQSAYGKNVLPIDASDFVATHLLVCTKRNEELLPIMGFRSIELNRCDEFHLPFPALSLLRNARNAESHLRYVEKLIEECKGARTPVYYLSSWAIDPEVRNHEKFLVHQLTPFFGSMIYLQHQRSSLIKLIAGGVIQFRVPNLLALLGFEAASIGGSELPPFGASFIHDTPTQLMQLRSFTPYASQQAAKYQNFWKNRIVISDDDQTEILDIKKAA